MKRLEAVKLIQNMVENNSLGNVSPDVGTKILTMVEEWGMLPPAVKERVSGVVSGQFYDVSDSMVNEKHKWE